MLPVPFIIAAGVLLGMKAAVVLAIALFATMMLQERKGEHDRRDSR